MKKITSIFLVAILYGCGSSVSPVDQGLIDQVMHIGNGSEPQGFCLLYTSPSPRDY